MSILHGAASADRQQREIALRRFCERYTEPLVDYLIHTKRIDRESADETVQDFWLHRFLEPGLDSTLITKFLKAKKSSPDLSFRRYLAKSLGNFFTNRYQRADSKRQRQIVPLEHVPVAAAAKAEDDLEFDALWANHLLRRVLEHVQQECLSGGHESKWRVFVELILRPATDGIASPGYSQLANELGLRNPKAVGNAWMTVKRMIHRHFSIAVQDYLPAESKDQSRADAECEVKAILGQLASQGGLRLHCSGNELNWDVESQSSICIEGQSTGDLYRSEEDLRVIWMQIQDQSFAELLDLSVNFANKVRLYDLTHDTRLTVEHLNQIRRASKKKGTQRNNTFSETNFLPKETFGAIYLIAIVVSQLRWNHHLSSDQPAKLAHRAEALVNARWLDPESLNYLQRYIDQFEGSS